MFCISLLTDLSVAARLCVITASADEVSIDPLLPKPPPPPPPPPVATVTGPDLADAVAVETVDDPGIAPRLAAVTGEAGDLAAGAAPGLTSPVLFVFSIFSS